MDWFRLRAKTVIDAFTLRRVIALPIVIAVVTAVIHASASLSELFARQEGQMLLGIPSWVYGLLAGLLLLLYFIIEYATRLRLQIAPNIKLDFEPSGGCLVATPISDIQNGQIIRTVQGMYARIKVTNTGVLAAKECEAALIGLSRERCDKLWEQINLHDTFDLPWSLRPGREYLPMAIGVGLRRYFDVFYTREDTNEIHMIGGWPLRLTEVFKKPGVYKFEVAVLSEGVTTKREIVVEWTGTWNAIKFR